MRSLPVMALAVFITGVLVLGCSQEPAKKAAADSYDIQGKIIAIRTDKTGVKLDHQDIPGLMKGMQMEFPVKEPKLLEGLKADDQVQGKLQVESGKYVITDLKKH
jgi:protein SCO1/2